MTTIALQKRPGNVLLPVTPLDVAILDRIRNGDVITIEFTHKRNGGFFAKWHVLVNYAFDIWEPEEGAPEKNYERFRKEITMLAGYYREVPSIRGGVRYEADSISWAKMDPDTFALMYTATCDVLIKWVLREYTREDIDRVLTHVAEFAA